MDNKREVEVQEATRCQHVKYWIPTVVCIEQWQAVLFLAKCNMRI